MQFVDDLRDDDLPGEPGDPRHTYMGLMQQNMEIMVPALGGNVAAFEGFDPSPVFVCYIHFLTNAGLANLS